MYVYIKDGRIISNPLVPISKEADRVVEIDYDPNQPDPYVLRLDDDGNPYITYEKSPDPDPISEPEPLTARQKLEAAGLTVEELKELLGL